MVAVQHDSVEPVLTLLQANALTDAAYDFLINSTPTDVLVDESPLIQNKRRNLEAIQAFRRDAAAGPS